MKLVAAIVAVALLACAVIWAQNRSGNVSKRKKPAITQQNNAENSNENTSENTTPVAPKEVSAAIEKGAKWLASVQGADGGWGQDGGATSNIRQTERLESNNNDVANTAVAALALLRAGKEYRPNVERAVNFILKHIEASPGDGLSITSVNQTQIQRKLGPYIDTFLASMLLAEVDGTLADKARVRAGLEKCVAKIERNQGSDGSWNVGGGWAPVLGTSLASRSLYQAGQKGVRVNEQVMARAETYTLKSQKDRTASGGGGGYGSGRGVGRGDLASVGGAVSSAPLSAAAGVELYQDAQALEQLSRTAEDRAKNKTEITAINRKLSDTRFVEGYGSIGGEEFFSYLNIGDSLRRTGGKEWNAWHTKISHKILKLQNNDGTWAGHHCITGRVAVTSAAILNLTPQA